MCADRNIPSNLVSPPSQSDTHASAVEHIVAIARDGRFSDEYVGNVVRSWLPLLSATHETKADPKGLAVIRAAQLDLAAQSLDRHDRHSLGEACRQSAALLRGFAGVATEKAETTPPLSLRDFGYAPGNYTCICFACGAEFVGDKRAIQCEPCAKSKLERSQEKTVEQSAESPLTSDGVPMDKREHQLPDDENARRMP